MPFYQDASTTLTLTLTRVAPAPVLVAEIAKATGRRLEVAPSLSTEILMVSVENARSADVLAKLAIAATARWEPTEGGYRLVADGAARSVEAGAERARRLQSFRDAIRKRQEAAKTTGGEEGDSPDMGAMFGGGDGTDGFLPLLDLSALAAMEPGDRLVFATGANGVQRPLRGNPVPLVADLIARHNKMAKGMAGNVDAMPEQLTGFMQGPLGERIKKMSRPIVGTPTKVLVVASRGANPIFGGGDDVRLEVRAYDAKGVVLIEETGSVGTNMMERFVAMATKKPVAPGTTKTTPIDYTDDAKALLATRGGNTMMGPGMGGPKLTTSLRKRLFAPQEFEPLALIPGEGLAALAKARRKPLVACVPDAAYPGLLAFDVPQTLEDLEGSMKTGPMRLVPDAEFLVVKPAEPDTARRGRLDRNALATFMRAVADHESPTLGELSDFASRTPAPSRNAVSMSFLSTFAPNVMGSMSGMVSWDALRLYAALTATQRESLAGGARIPFDNLGPAAQTSLRVLLYGAGDNLTVERGAASDLPDVISMGMKMMMGGSGIDARDEPTEVAPRGLPAGGYLQATVTEETILRPTTEGGPAFYSLGTDELAMIRMVSSSGIGASMGDAMKLPETARLGSRTLWNLRGYVGSDAYVGSVLQDDRTPKNGQQVSLSALPADLQAKVAAKAERWKKSPLGAIMSMGEAFGKPQARP